MIPPLFWGFGRCLYCTDPHGPSAVHPSLGLELDVSILGVWWWLDDSFRL